MNKKSLLLIYGVSLLSFTGFLDATIVSTALPNIQRSLSMSIGQLQWILNAFFLGISAFMASMGRIGDIYGRRKLFYIGTIVFGLASIGAGCAYSIGFLIFCRLIQGITTAITIPVGVAIIQAGTEKDKIPKAMAIFGTLTGAGLALGPIVGGLLVTAFGWPSIFFVNIPFIVVGFLMCLGSVEESKSANKVSLDYLGIIFLSLTVAGLVIGTVNANDWGWDSPWTISWFCISGLSLVLLIIVERFVKDPILAGYLFQNRCFIPCALCTFLGGATMGVILFIDPLYLHSIFKKTDLVIGLLLFIISMVVMISAYIVGHIHKHLGSKKMLFIATGGYFLTAIIHMTVGLHFNYFLIVPAFVLMGISWGIINTVPSIAINEHFESSHLGVAMGALFSFFNIGASVVLAFAVWIFHKISYLNLMNQLSTLEDKIDVLPTSLIKKFIGHPQKLYELTDKLGISPETATLYIKNAFITGLHYMYIPIAILAVTAFFSLFFYNKKNVC